MSASDFVERYWNLSVDADLPNMPFSAKVSINKYLIATQSNISVVQSNQAAVIGKIRQSGALFDAGMKTRLALGKGSPDDMEFLLGSAVEAGALKADARALQQWADANLGVDCTGFVIAYLVDIGVLSWNSTLNGGAGCPWIYVTVAKKNWQTNKYALTPEIWNTDDMQEDDIILWMKSGGGPETRRPGHISLVVDASASGVECAESSGEPDGAGHSGPRHKVRQLNSVQSGGGKQWWQLGGGVIVVRPSGK
jgi:hypothetical protein